MLKLSSSRGIRIDVPVLSVSWSFVDHSVIMQALRKGLIEHEASDTGGVPRWKSSCPDRLAEATCSTPKTISASNMWPLPISCWFIPKVREFNQVERGGNGRGSEGSSHESGCILYSIYIYRYIASQSPEQAGRAFT